MTDIVNSALEKIDVTAKFTDLVAKVPESTKGFVRTAAEQARTTIETAVEQAKIVTRPADDPNKFAEYVSPVDDPNVVATEQANRVTKLMETYLQPQTEFVYAITPDRADYLEKQAFNLSTDKAALILERDKLVDALKIKTAEYVTLDTEYQRVNSDLKIAQQEIARQAAEINANNATISANEAKIKSLEADKSILEQKLQQAILDKQSAETQINTLQSQLLPLQQQLTTLQLNLQQAEADLKKEKQDSANAIAAEKAKSAADLADQKQKLSEQYQQQLQATQQQYTNNLAAEQTKNEVAYKALEAKFQAEQEEKLKLSTALAADAATYQSKLQAQTKAYQEKITELTNEHEKTITALKERHEKELKSLQSQQPPAPVAAPIKKMELSALYEQVNNLNKQVYAQKLNLNKQTAEIERLNELIVNLNNELQPKEGKIASLKAANQQLMEQVAQLQKDIAELQAAPTVQANSVEADTLRQQLAEKQAEIREYVNTITQISKMYQTDIINHDLLPGKVRNTLNENVQFRDILTRISTAFGIDKNVAESQFDTLPSLVKMQSILQSVEKIIPDVNKLINSMGSKTMKEMVGTIDYVISSLNDINTSLQNTSTIKGESKIVNDIRNVVSDISGDINDKISALKNLQIRASDIVKLHNDIEDIKINTLNPGAIEDAIINMNQAVSAMKSQIRTNITVVEGLDDIHRLLISSTNNVLQSVGIKPIDANDVFESEDVKSRVKKDLQGIDLEKSRNASEIFANNYKVSINKFLSDVSAKLTEWSNTIKKDTNKKVRDINDQLLKQNEVLGIFTNVISGSKLTADQLYDGKELLEEGLTLIKKRSDDYNTLLSVIGVDNPDVMDLIEGYKRMQTQIESLTTQLSNVQPSISSFDRRKTLTAAEIKSISSNSQRRATLTTGGNENTYKGGGFADTATACFIGGLLWWGLVGLVIFLALLVIVMLFRQIYFQQFKPKSEYQYKYNSDNYY